MIQPDLATFAVGLLAYPYEGCTRLHLEHLLVLHPPLQLVHVGGAGQLLHAGGEAWKVTGVGREGVWMMGPAQ